MYSMTGYGKAIKELDGRTLTIELKSVNNRFLDINNKMPKILLFAEDRLRKEIQAAISRGRVLFQSQGQRPPPIPTSKTSTMPTVTHIRN